MTVEEEMLALAAARSAAEVRGIAYPFKSAEIKITKHHQYGGEHVGQDFIKIYRAGKPSYLCMLQPNYDAGVQEGFKCQSFKVDALEMPVLYSDAGPNQLAMPDDPDLEPGYYWIYTNITGWVPAELDVEGAFHCAGFDLEFEPDELSSIQAVGPRLTPPTVKP